VRVPSKAAYLALAAAVLFVSCDPPGKPKREEAENREAILDFQTLYKDNCSGCHGLDGKNGPARILNDGVYLAVLPHDELRQILVYGRPGTNMPAFARSEGGPLTDKQIDALANGFYSHWSKPGGAPANAPKYTATSAGDAGAGKKLYSMRCFMCHGQGARFGNLGSPNYLDLVSSQMLRTSIIVGRPDLGMPNYRQLALTEQNITDVVAYLNSLRLGPAPGVVNANTNPIRSGNNGTQTVKGNEGSGHGPGSPRHEENEGNNGNGSSSQRGVK